MKKSFAACTYAAADTAAPASARVDALNVCPTANKRDNHTSKMPTCNALDSTPSCCASLHYDEPRPDLDDLLQTQHITFKEAHLLRRARAVYGVATHHQM